MARAFLGLVSGDAAARAVFGSRLQRAQRTRPLLDLRFETANLLLAVEGTEQRPLPDGKGIVLGRLHRNQNNAPLLLGDPVQDRMIYHSRGRALIENYWGGYVALLCSPDGELDIVKAPFGDLPCYLVAAKNGTLISSHPRLLAAFSDQPLAIDWPALSRSLAFGTIRGRETCLAGVMDVSGGERVTIVGGRHSWEALWSPWEWTVAERHIVDPEEAYSRIRATTDFVVRTAATGSTALLKLSGGLDSSIVAASLSKADVAFTALTLVTDDAAGDERDYAGAVADHLQIRLRQLRRDTAAIAIEASPAFQLPRPSIPGFRQSSDRLTADAADMLGATVAIDGGGGDNVFCSLQSAAPVADCLLAREGWRHCMRTAHSVAAIANVSTFEVLCRAVRRASGRQRDHRWPIDRQLLSKHALAFLPAAPAHPWLEAPPRTPPGRAAHVALVLGGQSYVEGLDPEQSPPMLVPLLAQPLVELCLRIPSWLWFADGHNRAAARHAFASALPASVVGRRSKGSPSSFIAQAAETYRTQICALLTTGELARHDMVDNAAIGALLAGEQPIDDRYLHRIMGLLDAEVWARSWK